MSKKILIIQRIFTNYRKPIFDELSKYYSIILLYPRLKSNIKQTTANYSELIGYIKYWKNDTNVFLNVFWKIYKYKPDIIIHEGSPGIISIPLVILLAKLLNIKFILWGHGFNRKKGFHPERLFESKLRLFYLKKSDAILLYGNEAKAILAQYIPVNKLFVAYNTLDTNKLLKLRDTFTAFGKEELKQKKNFVYKYNLVFIGRMLKDKYPELLIDIYERIKDKLNNDIGIHYIGIGEMLLPIKKIVEGKNYSDNFYFHGTIHDDYENGEILFCSDLMVMPGYLGLSVNHAFAFDCPVVSFKQGINGPFHSPEVEYVIDGKTGFLVENKNIEKMAKIIYNYLINQKLQKKVLQNIQNSCKTTCSLQNMINGFVNCINYLNNDK